MEKSKLELLSPVKNLESGIVAINCGADALYIGANSFGARAAAGNSYSDIEKLVNYAHKFNAKVYATVNTIFTDKQTNDIRNTMHELYQTGVDAYIIQDLGILQLDIPKLPIHASTQMDNFNLERIKFLESLGISRFVLARELSIKQIKEIRKNIKSELEFFVYGALCVSYSGRCYMSYALKGRSANRGECAQLCRIQYDLYDQKRRYLFKNKYLLSLKDLDLSSHLVDLMDSGISSFKIEGRLKDINYVKNVTGFFRKKIDEILENKQEYCKSSNGDISLGFEPNLDKTFNRSKTNYFIKGRKGEITSIHTPKSIGENLGKIKKINKNGFEIEFAKNDSKIINGDGLCYFDSNNELQGFLVNSCQNNVVNTNKILDISVGDNIYRNQDQFFENNLKSAKTERKILIDLKINLSSEKLLIKINNSLANEFALEEIPINNIEQFKLNLIKQFSKTGNTIFKIHKIDFDIGDNPSFISISKLNEIRRDILEMYEDYLLVEYKREMINREVKPNSYFINSLDYQGNVANSFSRELYQLAGVSNIEPAFELKSDFAGKVVMTTKHCLKYASGICPTYQKAIDKYSEPLYLEGGGHKYILDFDCEKCEMKIIW